jgi:hypothetical protein
MRIFARGIEPPFDVAIERPQHTDARVHQWTAIFGRHDQRLGRCLPFLEVLLGLRKFQDVIGRILECDKLPPAGQRYRVFEAPMPRQDQLRLETGLWRNVHDVADAIITRRPAVE